MARPKFQNILHDVPDFRVRSYGDVRYKEWGYRGMSRKKVGFEVLTDVVMTSSMIFVSSYNKT
jgi:hypothetical protein